MSSTYGFYVTAANTSGFHKAAAFGDAITVAGPKGPESVRKARHHGFDGQVLFDGTGYLGIDLDPATWIEQQRSASAARLWLPGVYVEWDRDNPTLSFRKIAHEADVARRYDAGMLLALDSRYIERHASDLAEAIGEASVPTAIVLSHRADPLASRSAVDGLRQIVRTVDDVSLLRADHGAIGALSCGATHASIGLTTTTRHLAPSGPVFRKRNSSARMFVRRLLAWYLASDIAGWNAAGADISCGLECCDGRSLADYLDEDLDATLHNLHALSDLAEYVLHCDPVDRAALFLDETRQAVERYGLAGFNGPEKPQPQLVAWAFS